NVQPGVFFYYSQFTVPANSCRTITIDQSTACSTNIRFQVQNASNVQLYDASCTSLSPGNVNLPNGGTAVNFQVCNTTGSAKTYIVSVKYDAHSIQGAFAPNP